MIRKAFVGFIILLVCTCGLWIFRFEVVGFFLALGQASRVERFYQNSPEKILQTSRELIDTDTKSLEAFAPLNGFSGGSGDAGPYLNSLLQWNLNQTLIPGKLDLSKEISQILGRDQNFSGLKLDWKKLNLDFSWLAKLHQFDYWSFDLAEPITSRRQEYTIYTAPVPDYTTLQKWCKLRLLQGRDQGQLAAAFADVHQVAKLILSTEVLVGSMVAVSLFRTERMLFDSLTPADQAKVKVQIMSAENYPKAKRYFWSQNAFTDLRLSDEAFSNFAQRSLALCQRVQVGMEYTIGMRKIMRPEFAKAYARLDQLVQKSNSLCRPSFLRNAWNDPEYDAIFKPNDSVFDVAGFSARPTPAFLKVTIRDLETHPDVGIPLGYHMLSQAEVSFLVPYEKALSH